MRTDLKVPFAEKDEAKKLGARWDAARKIWYVDGAKDLAAFARWSPTPHTGAGSATPAPQSGRQQATGKVIVGSKYVERTPVCDCPPWEVCDRCRSMALSG